MITIISLFYVMYVQHFLRRAVFMCKTASFENYVFSIIQNITNLKDIWSAVSVKFLFADYFLFVFSVPEDYKLNPGAVEAIAEYPTEPCKILIG